MVPSSCYCNTNPSIWVQGNYKLKPKRKIISHALIFPTSPSSTLYLYRQRYQTLAHKKQQPHECYLQLRQLPLLSSFPPHNPKAAADIQNKHPTSHRQRKLNPVQQSQYGVYLNCCCIYPLFFEKFQEPSLYNKATSQLQQAQHLRIPLY